MHEPMSGSELDELRAVAANLGVALGPVRPPRSRIARRHGHEVHYLDWGGPAASPIVLLHGGWLTAHTWDVVAAALAPSARCIAIDLPGHGLSSWTPSGDYTLDTHADAVEIVTAAAGLDEYVVAGMSLGGLVAVRTASRTPERVRGVMIVDVLPGAPAAQMPAFDEMVGFASFEDLVASMLGRNSARDPRSLRYFLSHHVDPSSRPVRWRHDPRIDEPDSITRSVAEQVAMGDELHRLSSPVVIVHGRNSRVVRSERVEEAVADRSAIRAIAVPEAGHTVQEHNPGALAAALASFVDDVW